MCGRYYVNEITWAEVQKVLAAAEGKLRMEAGDIHPSDRAVVITGGSRGMTAERMAWGFPQYQRKGILINARAENIFDRVTFRDSMLRRRCVVPAGGFYEWNRAKEKASFQRTDAPVLYMAGIYQRFEEEERFVILTTKANASVAAVHDRMPLILEEKELEKWIYEEAYAERLLKKVPVLLERRQEYEQQCLFGSCSDGHDAWNQNQAESNSLFTDRAEM